MGQTPLALIVLENQGNCTNPIHQRNSSRAVQQPELVGQSGHVAHSSQTQASVFAHVDAAYIFPQNVPMTVLNTHTRSPSALGQVVRTS